jgi:hypothetical protein
MNGTDDLDDRVVCLRGGVVVPAPAYVLLLDLERRDIHISREGADTLVVGPPERLTDADRALIRHWKQQLLLLLDYCTRPDLDAHLFADTRPEE